MTLDRDTEARLRRTYQAYTDEQLTELAAKRHDLTDLACEVLGDELHVRGIRLSPAAAQVPKTDDEDLLFASPTPPRGERQLWYTRPGDYVELAPDDCVFTFQTEDDLDAAQTALALEGIPSDSNVAVKQQLDGRGLLLGVLQEDSTRARAILSAPLSEEVRAQLEEQAKPDEWTVPSCPRCGAPDALLSSVTPVNTWECDECGYIWLEEA